MAGTRSDARLPATGISVVSATPTTLVSLTVLDHTRAMAASLKRIRESMSVKTTTREKGLTLTIKVTAYDNGMVEVDGIPINESPGYDQGGGAADVITTTLNEFRRQAGLHKKQLDG
jgi:hypothetical protein